MADPVLDRLIRRLYGRLGRHYRFVFPLAQDPGSLFLATVTVVLLTSYYNPTTGELVTMVAGAWASTIASLTFAHWMGRPYLARVLAWQETEHPSAEQSVEAWDAATGKGLWYSQIGGLTSPPETFMLDGKQHMLFAAPGGNLYLFVLN